MAVVIGQYVVNNNNKRRLDYGYGLKYPLTMTGETFELSYNNIVRLKSNLKILLSTKIGERINQPAFGTNLHKLLFEQDSEELNEKIYQTIARAVNTFVPQVTIQEIEVSKDRNLRDRGQMEVNITFRAAMTNEIFNVDFNVTA
jgi:phage baseplate assembly protein W